MNRLTHVLASVFLIIALLTPHLSFAQSEAGAQIQPSTIERGANPGDLIDTEIKVKNLSTTEQTYYLVVKDISGVKNNGVPVFAEEGAAPTGYEISSWLTVSQDPIVLKPNEEVKLPIKITVPQSATPGSHFGGVFVSMEPPRRRETGASVGYEVGCIVSIRIAGDVIENARIREFSTDKLIYSKPIVQFTTRVDNPGNVLIRPRGPLEVFNMAGKRVAIINVNDSLAGVFPGTNRDFETKWEEEDLAFGRYQGIVSLLYGEQGSQTTVSATVSFWILPAHIILPILGILAFIALAIYFGVRLHIRRTLESLHVAGTRRVAVRRRRDSGLTGLAAIALTILGVTALFLIGLLVLFA